jgi:predicted anti-sigma-YlaC factor YlaD
MTTTMLFDSVGHVDEEALDLFCAERLSPEDDLAVRQHLQVCEVCRDRARRESSFRKSVQENRDLFREPRKRGSERRGRRFSPDLFLGWRPVLALAAVIVTMVSLPVWRPAGLAEPVEVTLQAMRGAEGGEAPANRPLRLRLDLTGVRVDAGLSVQVVSRTGRPMGGGAATAEGGFARFVLETPPQAGQYWVRLMRGETIVREYSLPVR